MVTGHVTFEERLLALREDKRMAAELHTLKQAARKSACAKLQTDFISFLKRHSISVGPTMTGEFVFSVTMQQCGIEVMVQDDPELFRVTVNCRNHTVNYEDAVDLLITSSGIQI